MLGEFSFNSSSNTGNSGGALGSLESNISEIEGDVKGNVSSTINGAINDVAKALNIHDFYSVHMLDYVSTLSFGLPNFCDHMLTFVLTLVRGMNILYAYQIDLQKSYLLFLGLLRA